MYEYENERPKIFTEAGQGMFLKIRDRAKSLMKMAGAATMEKLTEGCIGSGWQMMACVDRLVELGELEEVPLSRDVAGQFRTFWPGEKWRGWA